MRLPGDQTFIDIGAIAGVDLVGDSRTAVAADFDGDGDLDLLVRSQQVPKLNLLRNDGPSGGSIEVRFPPNGYAGVVVTAIVGARRLVRPLLIGDGYLAQGPPRVFVGLAGAAKVDLLEIAFPSGRHLTLADVPAGSIVQVPASGDVLGVAARPRPFILGGAAARRPAPPCQLEWIENGLDPSTPPELRALLVRGADAKPLLINLWAPWCDACKPELRGLTRWAKKHPEVAVVAVSAEADLSLVETAVAALKIGVPVARLTAAAIGARPELAVPTTCLYEPGGQLSRGWVGAIDFAAVLAIGPVDVSTPRGVE